MRHNLFPNFIIILVMLSSACSAQGQSADRPPKIDPEALEIINTHLLGNSNCWSQELPPPMMLQMKSACSFEPEAHFTVRWQPPESLAITGQVSLLRAAKHHLKLSPGTHIHSADEFEAILESMKSKVVAELRERGESALNLINMMEMSSNGISYLAGKVLSDPLALVNTGLVDFEVDPSATGVWLVVTGISDGPLQGEKFQIHFSDGAPCFDQMVTTNAAGVVSCGIVWEARDQIILPVQMELCFNMGNASEPDTLRSKMTYQKVDGRWLPDKWYLDMPLLGEIVFLEVLAAYSNPDFSDFDWEDKLVFVDAEELDAMLRERTKAQREMYRILDEKY